MGSLRLETKLLERALALCLPEVLSGDSGFESRRRDRFQKCLHHGPLDANSSHSQTPAPSAAERSILSAIISRRQVLALIINPQAAATIAAGRQSLQQCRSFPMRDA
jgi:hypothetical protein